MPKLDFVCIGAAKCGTTTLHELLKDHPQVELPKAKEVPYFNNPELLDKGFEWYYSQCFKDTTSGVLHGTITPQYMYSRDGHTPGAVARGIYENNPDIKIVAILREPIERAFSHYKTAQRRVGADKNFEQATTDFLDYSKKPENREKDWDPVELAFYGSEYGTILEQYYAVFKKEQILVVYFEELKNNPQALINKLCKFIGVDSDYAIKTQKEVFNANGSAPKIGLLTPKYLHKSFVRKIWRIFPYNLRKLVEAKINSWNTKVDTTKIDTTTKEYAALKKYYAKELVKLESLTNSQNPWK